MAVKILKAVDHPPENRPNGKRLKTDESNGSSEEGASNSRLRRD